MIDNTRPLAKITYVLCTLFTIFLLVIFAIHRDNSIPLTLRSAFSDWGKLRAYAEAHAGNLTWAGLSEIAWCRANRSSPLCACLFAVANNATLQDPTLPPSVSVEALTGSCLRARPTWRKDVCDKFCSIHLLTPVLLMSLAGSLFLSRVSIFDSHFASVVAYYAPLVLAVVVIGLQLAFETYAGIFPSVAILFMLLDISYIPPCEDGAAAFWAYTKYHGAFLSAWVALTHQGRDWLLFVSFGFLGSFLGTLVYYDYLARRRPCSDAAKRIRLYNWVGICCIVGALLLLVEQAYLPHSPARSSAISLVSLSVFCAQCLPLLLVSDRVQMGVGLVCVSVCVLAAALDVLGGWV